MKLTVLFLSIAWTSVAATVTTFHVTLPPLLSNGSDLRYYLVCQAPGIDRPTLTAAGLHHSQQIGSVLKPLHRTGTTTHLRQVALVELKHNHLAQFPQMIGQEPFN